MLKKSMQTVAAITLLIAGVSGAAVLATLRSNSPAYPNPIRRVYEKPVFHTGKGDVVEIVRWGSPLVQVRTKTGRLGWIEAVRLDTVNIPPVLSISKPAAKAAKLTPAEDSALAKRWLEAQKGAQASPKSDSTKPAPTSSPKADSGKPAVVAPPAPAVAPAVPALPAASQDAKGAAEQPQTIKK